VLSGTPDAVSPAAAGPNQLRVSIAGAGGASANVRTTGPSGDVTFIYTYQVDEEPAVALVDGAGSIPLENSAEGYTLTFGAYSDLLQTKLVASKEVVVVSVVNGVVTIDAGPVTELDVELDFLTEGDGELWLLPNEYGMESGKISLFNADGSPHNVTGEGWNDNVYELDDETAEPIITIAAGRYIVQIELKDDAGKIYFIREAAVVWPGLDTIIDPTVDYAFPPFDVSALDREYTFTDTAANVDAAGEIFYTPASKELKYYPTGGAATTKTLDLFDAPLSALLGAFVENDVVTFASGKVTAIELDGATDSDITGSESLFGANLDITAGSGTVTFGDATTNLTIVDGTVETGAITGDVEITDTTEATIGAISGNLAVTAGTAVEVGTVGGDVGIVAGTVSTGAITGTFKTFSDSVDGEVVNTITGTPAESSPEDKAANALVVAVGVIEDGAITGTAIDVANETPETDIDPLFTAGATTVTLAGSGTVVLSDSAITLDGAAFTESGSQNVTFAAGTVFNASTGTIDVGNSTVEFATGSILTLSEGAILTAYATPGDQEDPEPITLTAGETDGEDDIVITNGANSVATLIAGVFTLTSHGDD
jgi:hypothetical protein